MFRTDKYQEVKTKLVLFGILAIMASYGGLSIILSSKAEAAKFAKAYVRLDHLTAGVATGGRVCATVSAIGAGTENKVVVTFPSDFTLVATPANWTVNTTFESGFAGVAWPGIGSAATAVDNTLKTATFSSSDITNASNLYCFNFSGTSTLTTGSVGQAPSPFASVETQTAGSSPIDKTYWGVSIVSGEIVTVNAIVAPFFTMALSGNTDTFATNLSSTAVNTSNGNRTIQVDTNALGGWIVWAKGTNSKTVSDTGSANLHGALTSATAGAYAISNNTVDALAAPSPAHAFTFPNEDYGLAVTLNNDGAGGGSPSMDAAYNGAVAGTGGVIDVTRYRPIASSAGTAAADRINIKMLATITNTTPPGGDYTDVLTYVGAGQF